MPKFARLLPTGEPNTVTAIDVHDVANATALDAMFHPAIRAEFVSVPAATVNGSTRTGTTWTHPVITEAAAPAAVTKRTTVSRTEYYGQFTAPEEAMIRIAASEEVTVAKIAAANNAEKQRLMGVAALQVMLRRTDALGPADKIDLTSAQVVEGLGLLVAMTLLTSARKTEIEAGIPA